jgi:Phosphoinositide phospholipase C, Ca2+-dependent
MENCGKVWRLFAIQLLVWCTVMVHAQREAGIYAAQKLNQLQIIGSHNSYKMAIEPALWQLIYRQDSARAMALQYEHISLKGQLEMGLRNLELDVVHDPQGSRYVNPKGIQWLSQMGQKTLPYDTAGNMQKPGLKVFHVQDVDFRSHNALFTDALKELKDWSERHKGHLPVIITINAKDDNQAGLSTLLPFTKAALDSIDLEISSLFGVKQLITPDLVRGKYATLAQAVLENGWPAVKVLTGRFLFVLDETGGKRQAYLQDHPHLQGRVMFTNEPHGSPNASFMIINDPIRDSALIRSMVSKGYLVRTRADADTREARNNDYSRFEAAKFCGAQVITTDYYLPSRLFPSSFNIAFEDGAFVRGNPLNK